MIWLWEIFNKIFRPSHEEFVKLSETAVADVRQISSSWKELLEEQKQRGDRLELEVQRLEEEFEDLRDRKRECEERAARIEKRVAELERLVEKLTEELKYLEQQDAEWAELPKRDESDV